MKEHNPDNNHKYQIEGGESDQDVINRAADFLQKEIVMKEFNSDLSDS